MLINQSVKPIWGRTKDSDEHMGWVFPDLDTEEPGADPDPLNGAKSIRELYEIASANYSGKYTVPVCANVYILRDYVETFRYVTCMYMPCVRFFGIRN